MTFATRNEVEYLSARDSESEVDGDLLEELGDRLEALRRYDQCVSESDWRPPIRCGVDSREDGLLKDM